MSKQPSELTIAIRQLCDETKGEITHAESRERLPEMGHAVVPEPGRKSKEYAQWEDYEVDYEDKESIRLTAEACGFTDDAMVKAVVKEHKLRKAFESECNNFNVTKYNWKKALESGKPTTSRKPAAARNTKSRTAVKPTAPGSTDEALLVVKKRGGLAKCQEKLGKLEARVTRLTDEIAKRQERIDKDNAEIEELQASVEVVAELAKTLKDAA